MSFINDMDIYSTKSIEERFTQFREIVDNNEQITPESFRHIDAIHLGGGYTNLHQFLQNYFSDSQPKVFEIGCGVGGTSRYIAQYFNCEILAMDYLEGFLEIAEFATFHTKQLEKITFKQGDINNFEVEEGVYDLAITIAVFEHVKGVEGFNTIYRALIPGGLFYFEDYMLVCERENINDIDLNKIKDFGLPDVRSKESIIRDLDEAGFECIDFEDFFYEFSYYAWDRAEKIARNYFESEENRELFAGIFKNFAEALPGLMRGVDRETVEEKYPLTCEIGGNIELVGQPNTLTWAKIIFRKRPI